MSIQISEFDITTISYNCYCWLKVPKTPHMLILQCIKRYLFIVQSSVHATLSSGVMNHLRANEKEALTLWAEKATAATGESSSALPSISTCDNK
jgi:hypothetical protein